MPEIISCPVDEDSFVVLPVIVITQGRDDTGAPCAGWLITCQWMMWGFGIVLEF